MATYIAESDITDASLKETALATLLTAKVTDSDAAVVDMAKAKGVADTDIETSPVHRLVKQWAVAWVCKELSFDLIGKNPTDSLDTNIYSQLFGLYSKRLADCEGQISVEVLMGTDDRVAERQGPRTGFLMFGG